METPSLRGAGPRTSRMPRWIRWTVGLALALLVLGLLGRQVLSDWREVERTLRSQFHFDPLPLIAAWIIQTAGWLLVVDTWRGILAHVHVHAPFSRHLQLYAWTALAHVLPGSVWTPASRVAFYRQRGARALDVGAAVVLEWLLLGVAGLLLYGASAPFAAATPPQGAWWLAGLALASLAILHPRVLRAALVWARGLRGDEPDSEDAGPPFGMRAVAGWLGRELVVLSLSGAALYLLMLAISPRASFADAMSAWALTVALANLFAWIPLTGLIKDGGMVLLLTPFYGSAIVALGLVAAWRIWMAGVELSWAGLGTMAAAMDRSGAQAGA